MNASTPKQQPSQWIIKVPNSHSGVREGQLQPRIAGQAYI